MHKWLSEICPDTAAHITPMEAGEVISAIVGDAPIRGLSSNGHSRLLNAHFFVSRTFIVQSNLARVSVGPE